MAPRRILNATMRFSKAAVTHLDNVSHTSTNVVKPSEGPRVPVMIKPWSNTVVTIAFNGSPAQLGIYMTDAYRGLFQVLLEEDKTFELVSSSTKFPSISKVEQFPKDEAKL